MNSPEITLSNGAVLRAVVDASSSFVIMTPEAVLFIDNVETVIGTYYDDNTLALYCAGHFIGRIIKLTEKDVKAVKDLKEMMA